MITKLFLISNVGSAIVETGLSIYNTYRLKNLVDERIELKLRELGIVQKTNDVEDEKILEA